MNDGELTGQIHTHIAAVQDPDCALHQHVIVPFLNLRRAAAADGFDLEPQSSFRDFSRQLTIWNGKFSGQRPMSDATGRPVDVSRLSAPERVDAILLWSALPGASRHHWGTDVDVIDGCAAAPDYRVQLTPEEFAPGGPFARLSEWLEKNSARFGFFRPFRGVRSGVQPEPWHLSFAPVAENARRALSPAVLYRAIAAAPLLGKEEVLSRLEELHTRYVANIDWP
ncbi:MAG: M15 family metallopeptidase [Gammaproteobacteria bacterium]